MTPDEEEVIRHIVKAWNKFLELPVEHSDEVTEFRHKIHDLQRMIMSRPIARELW
jgi:hypothetical protein